MKRILSLPNWPSKSHCLDIGGGGVRGREGGEGIELLKIKDRIMIQSENNNMLLLQNVVRMGSLH